MTREELQQATGLDAEVLETRSRVFNGADS
jgi:hypothetical protein